MALGYLVAVPEGEFLGDSTGCWSWFLVILYCSGVPGSSGLVQAGSAGGCMWSSIVLVVVHTCGSKG